mgnify:CR=1 FL=1
MMTVICDTREKPQAIQKILAEFERQQVKVIRSKLWVGDYQRLDNPMLVIDRKQNLAEICNVIAHEIIDGIFLSCKFGNIKHTRISVE